MKAAVRFAKLFIFVSTLTFWASNLPAQTNIEALLDAGEFGPARVAAAQLPAAARDAALSKIAQAQAAGGVRAGSLYTAGDIADDRTRRQVLDYVSTRAPSAPLPARGAAAADFDTLIDLITSTIAPQTWDEVGGPGAVDGFPGGVFVDAAGVLRKLPRDTSNASLALLRNQSTGGVSHEVQHEAALRKVSLTRLEKQLQLRWAAGQLPTEAMSNLAGIYQIKYVFVYPETGDLVIAGPAGAWTTNDEGRQVSIKTGKPVVQLDDLVVLLRNAYGPVGSFTCSITPTQQKLADAQAYLNEWAKQPLKPHQRREWSKGLRDALGMQEIEVTGIDPETRVARVIVEADYRMKLVGMGLEEGVLGVESYLDSIQVPAGGAPPATSVLRWWFTLNYKALQATKARNAFALQGQGVQVLSENELLTKLGKRVHTGQSDALNSQFARDFTQHFDALAAKYPIYAELKNVFDLALVAALCKAEDLPGQVAWHRTHFGDPTRFHVERSTAPTRVESVVNYRVLNEKYVVAGVSGGVSVDARPLVQPQAIQQDEYGLMSADRTGSVPRNLDRDAWWWD